MPDRKDVDFRLETDGGVPYRLQSGYPIIDGELGKVTATEVYLMPADKIGQFFEESMPGMQIINGQITINRGRGMPGAGFLVTKKVNFKPWQDYPGDPFWADKANLTEAVWKDTYAQCYVATIEYETSPIDDEDQNNGPNPANPESFLEHSINGGGQLIAVSPKKTTTVDASVSAHPEFMDPLNIPPADKKENKDPEAPLAIRIPSMEHNLRWKFVLNPPWNTIRQRLGKLNDEMHPLFFNVPTECIMFSGISGSQQFYWTGRALAPGLTTPGAVQAKPWTLDFKFSERYIYEASEIYGWNHIYKPSTGKWVRLLRNGKNLYETAKLLEVFQTVSPIGF